MSTSPPARAVLTEQDEIFGRNAAHERAKSFENVRSETVVENVEVRGADQQIDQHPQRQRQPYAYCDDKKYTPEYPG